MQRYEECLMPSLNMAVAALFWLIRVMVAILCHSQWILTNWDNFSFIKIIKHPSTTV